MNKHSAEALLSIIRLGIGHSSYASLNPIDWTALKKLADEQGVLGVIVDGIENMPESSRPPKTVLLEWIGEVLQSYEYRYELYCRDISEMADWYNSHGFKMMVLKGYACSLNWPKPEHRPCGDIDIWLFGKQKEADGQLVKEKGIKIDSTHHHHTVFYWRDILVENHYDFINIHHHKSHLELESVFKELGRDDTHSVELHGKRVYIPSPNLHALFLIKHLSLHFASEYVTIRQLLDWAFFVEKHSREIDWPWLEGELEKYGMKRLFDVFNAICVGDLGFDVNIFPKVQFDPSLKNRVLNDILSPEFSEVEKGGFVSRAIYKYRRWKANGWKHKHSYKESMWSAFWYGVKGHLLKPASI